MRAFVAFTDKYLWPYGCSSSSFTAADNCTNRKTEIQSEIIEIHIIEMQL